MASWPTWLAAGLIGYVGLCSLLRFRYEKSMRRKFDFPDRASLARMTNDEAQAIMQYMITMEFPQLYKLALQFAIFKTYGIPSISKLLVATKSFSEASTASKRYEDTTVIFAVFSLSPPTSDQCLKAIARMNFLHSPFVAAGQITNADLLYTLSVCITDIERFMRLYEWRAINDMERCALGTFWKSIGDAMQIRYDGYLSRREWRDGIEFADDIGAWAKTYEIEHMRPDINNTKPAVALVDLLTFYVPTPFKPFALEVLTVLMGDRVREAFMYPEPGILAAMVAYLALNVRRLIMRYLMLPRVRPFCYFSEPDATTGRIAHWDYLVKPYYHPPTIWSRWGPMGLITRLLGGYVPSSDPQLMPQGFLFEELGPDSRRGRGIEAMKSDRERLQKERISGCPFVRL